jgi:hypothetical protein
MHELLIALVFVGMVACPAVVASWPHRRDEGDLELDTPTIASLKSPRSRVA